MRQKLRIARNAFYAVNFIISKLEINSRMLAASQNQSYCSHRCSVLLHCSDAADPYLPSTKCRNINNHKSFNHLTFLISSALPRKPIFIITSTSRVVDVTWKTSVSICSSICFLRSTASMILRTELAIVSILWIVSLNQDIITEISEENALCSALILLICDDTGTQFVHGDS
jgi:hypothetical protein